MCHYYLHYKQMIPAPSDYIMASILASNMVYGFINGLGAIAMRLTVIPSVKLPVNVISSNINVVLWA